MVQIKGIDISSYQGKVDYNQVKNSGVDFVMIKATQGTRYARTDYFNNNCPQALGAGLEVGGYHYGTFKDVASAKAEANYFISVIRSHKITYPVVCDIEDPIQRGVDKKTLTDSLIAFLEVLEGAGYFAMYYTFADFLQHNLEADRLKPYAQWGAMFKGDMWQYDQHGKVPGIAGEVDLDYSFRDFAKEIADKQKMKQASVGVAQKVAEPVSKTYVVQAGDSLSKISGKLGVSVSDLEGKNKISNPNLIFVGQKINY